MRLVLRTEGGCAELTATKEVSVRSVLSVVKKPDGHSTFAAPDSYNPFMAKSETIRVANAGGYWGDDLGAFQRQLSQGPVDYLTQDFLAEITMSILQKQRSRNPKLGYAVDFLEQARQGLALVARDGVRVITNAGGINPSGCAREVARIAREQKLDLAIGIVEGDDLINRLDDLLAQGVDLANMETGESLHSIRDQVVSANAYLGAAPVVAALEEGCRVVITGRVTDTGIAAAPPIFEYGWQWDDWNSLAAAVVAGHILECGAQSTGGNFTDWQEIPSFLNMGYPIAEFQSDGRFTVTKHPASGGLVNRRTVGAQLIYEMGDPRHYITPDVVADFTSIRLAESGPNRVAVSGVEGRPRTDSLKVSIAYRNGYKAHGTMIVSRPEAVDKCRTMAEVFWRRLGIEFEETSTELVGYDSCHRHLSPSADPAEILLRLGVRDPDADKVAEFAKLFTSLILNTVPGVAIVGARPRVQDVIAYWPCLIPASQVEPRVTVLDSSRSLAVPWLPPPAEQTRTSSPPDGSAGRHPTVSARETRKAPLSSLCFGRSGDKGDTCNIGIVARSREAYSWIEKELSASRVKEYFGDLCRGEVERFEVPNLLALNFLLHESLGGGGTLSLRIDPQGKTLADALLLMEMNVPGELLD